MNQPRLAFISPVFLFPNDTGGRIRTTNILRGLKGGAFDVTLIGPASAQQRTDWASQLDGLADRFVPWQPAPAKSRWMRVADLFGDLPVNVAVDRTREGLETVRRTLAATAYDVVVFDFVHAAVLQPIGLAAASVCFTHNVEAEIFARHAEKAGNWLLRRVWAAQYAKMQRYERDALRRFTSVIAVSERDATHFRQNYGVHNTAAIPTGVDLDYFGWQAPPEHGDAPTVVFTGSMDWAANIDGIGFFLSEVWPKVLERTPEAQFVVVGRSPPPALVEQGRALRGVRFTGYVDDVRPYVRSASAFVIPLRVGGGTRIKAFEAMAMGCPVVSTAVGIEGLDVTPNEHYLLRDGATDQAEAIVNLLRDDTLRRGLSQRARACVEQKFGHRVAARVFEQICLDALNKQRNG